MPLTALEHVLHNLRRGVELAERMAGNGDDGLDCLETLHYYVDKEIPVLERLIFAQTESSRASTQNLALAKENAALKSEIQKLRKKAVDDEEERRAMVAGDSEEDKRRAKVVQRCPQPKSILKNSRDGHENVAVASGKS